MAGRKTRYKPREIIAQVPGTGGLISEIALRLGVSDRTIMAYQKRFPSVQRAIHVERNQTLDLAESQLLMLIQEKHFPAIRFYLENIGRSRGYGQPIVEVERERQSVEIKLDLSGFTQEELRRIDRAIEGERDDDI
jgi:HSP20 family molecular chaperone IbpA